MSSSSIEKVLHPPVAGGGKVTCGEGAKSRLELTFSRDRAGKTYLSRQYAAYPFHVCRVQYLDRAPEGFASLYIQSSAGGLYEGDRLEVSIRNEAGAHALVTTQASSIVHRSRGPETRQKVTLTLEDDSLLEFLPDPTILFADAICASRLHVSVAERARAVLAESFVWHDPEGLKRPFRQYRSETTVTTAHGDRLVTDRLDLSGDQALREDRGVMGSNGAQGTLLVISRDAQDISKLVTLLRGSLNDLEGVYAGVSALPNQAGVAVRFLAVDGVGLRSALWASSAQARLALLGSYPAKRRK